MTFEVKSIVASQINAICAAKGVNVKGLSEELGWPYSTMLNYSQGKSEPKFEFFMQLYSFGINLDWFIAGEGEMYRANRPDQRPVAYQFAADGKKVGDTAVYGDNRVLRMQQWVGQICQQRPDDVPVIEERLRRAFPEFERWERGD